MEEFHKFGKHKSKVKKLIDEDDYTVTKKFYGNLSKTYKEVKYIDYFWNAYDSIKKSKKPTVIITRIELFNQYEVGPNKQTNFHAVALIKDGDEFYMFDANGICKKTDSMLYVNEYGKTFYSHTFSKKYNLDLPRFRGIQYYTPKSPNGYINDGGYCMFYTYIGVERVVQKYLKSKGENLVILFKKLTEKKNDFELFFPKDIHIQSLKIINSIF
tara:strand:+ start:322 stop:963 length:642 start_codon:yes stop_codon:yes gene_type:complete